MLRGLDSAASGMIALERRQEALANNLANAQTAGYKKDDTVMRSFPKLMLERIRDFKETGNVPIAGISSIPSQTQQIGELFNGVYAQERVPNFAQGALVQTDNALDVAIEDQSLPTQTVNGRQVKPAALFAVQLADGSVGYTRNGKFDLDAAGNLVTAEGDRVLGANQQPIQITGSVDKEDLSIDSEGRIIAYPNDPSKMRVAGQIGIVLAQNPGDLQRSGGNVYHTTNPLPFQTGNSSVSLHQGFVEQSNVDAGQTMTEMMTTVRGYEANQKVIGAYDSSLQQLFSIGKMNG